MARTIVGVDSPGGAILHIVHQVPAPAKSAVKWLLLPACPAASTARTSRRSYATIRPPTLNSQTGGSNDQDRQDYNRWAHGCGAGACDGAANAKDKVKVGFIGPLTGGVSVNGLGGRNSADLAVRLRNADAEGEIRIRAGRARRRVQAERRGAGRDQDGGRQGHHRRRHALLLGDRDRDRRHLSQVRLPGDRVGRGAARHHLSQQIRRGASRQRHDDQPERRQCRADLQARLQDRGGDPRHHRLRQGPQRVFQQGAREASARPRSSAPSASPPTSRTSPPSSPRSRRSIPT